VGSDDRGSSVREFAKKHNGGCRMNKLWNLLRRCYEGDEPCIEILVRSVY
jgi:hypothetical protein